MANVMTTGAGYETMRFRGAGSRAEKAAQAANKLGAQKPVRWVERHTTLMVDLMRRSAQPPWTPSLSLAFRMLVFIRFTAAMYTGFSDCDEVFNFWEPLHYLSHGTGFQTWELAPEFAIRSWSFIAAHLPLVELVPWILGFGKRQQFFALRISYAFICSFAEARFYRAIVENVNDRAGKYWLFMMMFSAGMWSASTSFIPSTVTMFTTLLAYSFTLPITSSLTSKATRRVSAAVFFFASGAVFAWPFSLLLSLPFLVEEVFVNGADKALWSGKGALAVKRVGRLAGSALLAGLVVITPIVILDSYAYGKWTFPTLNIVLYNIFSKSKGPELYGTESSTYYLTNLFLNFNFMLPMALFSLPALAITYMFDYRRLGAAQRRPKADESSPYTLMAIRLSGFYLWLAVLSAQAHKEERFMYPLYPLLGLNAAVTLFLARGWVENTYAVATKSAYKASPNNTLSIYFSPNKITDYPTPSPFQASITKLMGWLTLAVVLSVSAISFSRILAVQFYYFAPLRVTHHLEYDELPSLLHTRGFKPIAHNGTNDWDQWDLSPLLTIELEEPLRLCFGKEWYRYTGGWTVPNGVDVRFIKSGFDGNLPQRFPESGPTPDGMWRREGTRWPTTGLNDMNEGDASVYVEPSTCTYLIDSYYPHQAASSDPTYTQSPDWERLDCLPILDTQNTPSHVRAFWLPGKWAEEQRQWGEFCLLAKKEGRNSAERTYVRKVSEKTF